MSPTVVVVGDTLLDRDITGVADRLCPDAPVPVLTETSTVERAGGAGLAASFLAADGADVVLVTALADDQAGDRVRELLAAAGVTLVELPYLGATVEKIRLRAGDHPLLRLDRGVQPGRYGDVPDAVAAAVAEAATVLVSDYGRGVTALPGLRRVLVNAAPRVPIVWDPHPKGATPVQGTRLVCPNRAEAAGFAALHGAVMNGTPEPEPDAIAAEARLLCLAWHARAVVVTLGGHGAMLVRPDGVGQLIPTTARHRGDTCGAGDRFAAAAAYGLTRSGDVAAAVARAVAAASSYVADGGPASLAPARTLEGSVGHGY
jgi:rfaE bifunctional protein kinase chain/domain